MQVYFSDTLEVFTFFDVWDFQELSVIFFYISTIAAVYIVSATLYI